MICVLCRIAKHTRAAKQVELWTRHRTRFEKSRQRLFVKVLSSRLANWRGNKEARVKMFDAVRIYYSTMRVELIGHFKPCTTEIYLHIDARMAD